MFLQESFYFCVFVLWIYLELLLVTKGTLPFLEVIHNWSDCQEEKVHVSQTESLSLKLFQTPDDKVSEV